jgi:hypothetical protein
MRISMRVLFAVIALVMLLVPRLARADQSGGHTVPVAVLTFDSEDAEDQADAFTGALRSRIRAAQGWSLIETAQSLGMLTAALKCPSRPPPDCQQRIGEQIKAERYIWGYVSKGPQSGQVTAEIHLYQRGKPDTLIKENYADNLKDQNDDTLRKIAARVLERLGGQAVGVVVVTGPSDLNGEVIVDGDKRVPLTSGSARLELAPGSHAVEVVPASGAPPTKRTILVTAGKESQFDVGAAASANTEPTEPDKPFPMRKLVGGVMIAGGVGLGVLAVQQFLFWNDLQDRGDQEAKFVTTDKAPCETSDEHFSNIHKRARTAPAIATASGTVGAVLIGAGVYFAFLSGDSSSERGTDAAKNKPPKPKTRFAPSFGPTGGGFALSGTF